MSMKNSNDTIGNRSCDLLVLYRSASTTAPPRAPTEGSTASFSSFDVDSPRTVLSDWLTLKMKTNNRYKNIPEDQFFVQCAQSSREWTLKKYYSCEDGSHHVDCHNAMWKERRNNHITKQQPKYRVRINYRRI
jgi:hypothetical protein